MDIAALRARFPGYSDDEIAGAVQAARFPDYTVQQVKDAMGIVPPKRGAIRTVGDIGLEVGSGAVRGVKFVSDAFGAENAVSGALGKADTFLRDYLSAQAKGEDQEVARIMAEAQDAGVWEQVKAGVKAFGVAPVRTAVGAVATGLPMIAAGMAVPGAGPAAAAARLGAMGAAGAVQGAGIAKSQIYQAVKEEAAKAGMDSDSSERLALAAQEYGSQNLDSIITAAGLGAAGAMTGLQPVLARAFARVQAQAAAKEAVPGVTRSLFTGVAKETPLEAAQGGQEQLSGNLAAQREGFEVPTLRGVASSAAMEGLAAAPGGAVGGVMGRGQDLRAQQARDDAQRLIAAGDAAGQQTLDAIAAAPDAHSAVAAFAAAPAAPLIVEPGRPDLSMSPRAANAAEIAEIRMLDPADQKLALDLRATARNPKSPPQSRRSAQNQLDALLLQVRQPPVADVTELAPEVADTERLTKPAMTLRERTEALKARTQAVRERFAPPIPAGEASELAVEPVEPARGLPEAPVRAARTARQDEDPNAVVRRVIDGLRGVNTMQARAYVKDFDAGRVTPQDVLDFVGWKPMPREEAERRIASAADEGRRKSAEIEDRLDRAARQGEKATRGALLFTSDGMPYGTRAAANARATREGGGSIIEVPGGWAVRPTEGTQDATAGQPTAGGPGGPGVGRGAEPGRGAGDMEPAAGAAPGAEVAGPAGPPAGSRPAPSAVADAGGPDAALSKDFTSGMSATRTRAVNMALDSMLPGGKTSRRQAVSDLVKAGAKVQKARDGQRTLRSGKQKLDEKTIGRTAMDYAEWLMKQPAAAATPEEVTAPASPRAEQLRKRVWEMTRDEAAAEFPGDEYDKALNRASDVGNLAYVEADRRSRLNSAGQRKLWAMTRKQIEEQGKAQLKAARGDRAETNKLKATPQFAKWRLQAMSRAGKQEIESVKEYTAGLLEVHKERVQEALMEGKDVPAEVLADYPGLKRPAVTQEPQDATQEVTQRAGVPSEREGGAGSGQADNAGAGDSAQREAAVEAEEVAQRPAEPVAVPEATHKDPGQPAEIATKEVVREAIADAAEKRDVPVKEMRATALRLIDEAIARAPSSAEVDQQIRVNDPKTERGKKTFTGVRGFDDGESIMVEARETSDGKWTVTDESYDGSGTGTKRRTVLGELVGGPAVARDQMRHLLRLLKQDGTVGEPDMVSIRVPGDGTFKVINTKERLAEFRRKVETSQGFKERQKPSEPGRDYGVERGSGGAETAIRAMIDEGDAQAAVDYAAMKDIDIRDLLDGDKVRLRKVAGLEPTAEPMVEAEPARLAPEATPATQEAAPAPPTVDPFVGNYDSLVGKTISLTVPLEDGRTATMRVDAAAAMRDADRRLKVLQELRACIGRAG